MPESVNVSHSAFGESDGESDGYPPLVLLFGSLPPTDHRLFGKMQTFLVVRPVYAGLRKIRVLDLVEWWSFGNSFVKEQTYGK